MRSAKRRRQQDERQRRAPGATPRRLCEGARVRAGGVAPARPPAVRQGWVAGANDAGRGPSQERATPASSAERRQGFGRSSRAGAFAGRGPERLRRAEVGASRTRAATTRRLADADARRAARAGACSGAVGGRGASRSAHVFARAPRRVRSQTWSGSTSTSPALAPPSTTSYAPPRREEEGLKASKIRRARTR